MREISCDYIELVRKKWPKVRVVEKESSRLMKVIGWFLYVTCINKDFFDYITTIHWVIYWPKDLPIGDSEAFRILNHELKHVHQYKTYGILYDFAYMLWPILSPLAFLSFLAFVDLYHLFWLLFLLTWIPIPYTFRALFEAQAVAVEMVTMDMPDAFARGYFKSRAKYMFSTNKYFYMATESWAEKLMWKYYKNCDFPLLSTAERYRHGEKRS